MQSLSVVTAADPNRLNYLAATQESVDALKKFVEFPVEWVLTLDGPTLQHVDGPDVVVEAAGAGGVAAARNLALSVASGDVIFPLDADDLAEPSGISRLMALLDEREDLGWVSGNRLFVDGSRTPHWVEVEREWKPGEIGASWTSPFYFHPNCLLVRRTLALRAGGWPALRTNEDLALLFAVARLGNGCSTSEILLRYRKWSGQVTSDNSYPVDKALAFKFIEQVENQWRETLALPHIKNPQKL